MIADIADKLANNTPLTIFEAAELLQTLLRSVQNASELDGLFNRGGVSPATLRVYSAAFIAGEGDEPEAASTTFSGTFMIHPAILLPSGDYADMGGMDNGVVKWFANSTTGELFGGSGKVVINDTGIIIMSDGVFDWNNSYKFLDSDGVSIMGGMTSYSTPTYNLIEVDTLSFAGKTSQVQMNAKAPTGQLSEVYLQVYKNDIPTVKVDVRDEGGGDAFVYINGGSGLRVGSALKPTEVVDVTGNGKFSGTIDASNFSGSSSGANTGDETGARLATLHHAASAKSAIIDADEVTGGNSAASFGLIRTTWTSIKAFLKTYFDGIYQAAGSYQPLDSDLTTIAGLTVTTDNIMQSKAGAWASRTLAQLMTDLAALGTTFQPLDSDLTTIAGLTATTDNFIQSKAGAWASRTVAQVITDLRLSLDSVYQLITAKDATGGYAGLTLLKINFKNAANTFTSFFTNANTAARTYTFKDADGTMAFTSDITGTNSGTNTGDVTLAGVPNYITIAAQIITRVLIDLTSHVTGILPVANGGTGLSATSGQYTPTLTGVTNVTGTTAVVCQWMRVGSMVTVSGFFNVDPTLTGSTEVGVSLPVASNFGATNQCGGTAASDSVVSESAAITGDITNHRAAVKWLTTTLNNHSMYFCFMYQVI